jgi:predicted DNA-binding transcriptional regulator AlpA
MLLWNRKKLISELGISETTLRRMEKKGDFVKGQRIGRRRYWRPDDVQDWVDQQMTCQHPDNDHKSDSWLSRFA